MKPPFAYYGGKTTLADRIAQLLPAHQHYVEPFAGSLAVLLAKQPSKLETVNDLDQDLMTFWQVLRDRSEDLAAAATLTPHSRAEHIACRDLDKPGGHILAFGGSRTWHRLAVAIEDAGFEVRDSIAWLYAQGFPKSLDVSKAIDKAAGAVREVVGERRKLDSYGPAAGNEVYGGGPDHGGVQQITAPASDHAKTWHGWGTALKPAFEPIVVGRKPVTGTVAGNVLAHGTETVGGGEKASGGFVEGYERGDGFVGRSVSSPVYRCAAGCQVAELDAHTGVLTSGANPTRRGSDKFRDAYGDFAGQDECTPARGADSGGASRFFPTFRYEAKAPTDERPRDGAVAHPTVKPLDLMRWLVRLVTPPGGLVLDPFAGSGTTAEACVIEGFRCITVEREAAYLPLIVARLSKPIQPDLFGGAA